MPMIFNARHWSRLRCNFVAIGLGGAYALSGNLGFSQTDSPVVSPVEIPGATAEKSSDVEKPNDFQPNSDKPIPVPLRNIANSIESARKNLSGDALPDSSITLSSLQSAINSLINHLAAAGAQRQSDRLAFLRIEELQKELAAAKPDDDLLNQIEKNTRQNYPGLDMPQVATFRKALQDHIVALKFGVEKDDIIKGLDQRLASLQKSLLEKGGSLSVLEVDRDLGLMVDYLTSTRQAASLRTEILSLYSKPTARVLVSDQFLRRAFTRPVSQTNPVNEVILGTRLQGNSLLSGQVIPQLVANNRSATLQLNLLAQFSSNNVGMNRGVKLLTSSQAGVSACETIQLTDHGLVSLNNTGVDTEFSSQINSIQHRFKIVRRIAAKKASEQKPQADAIGQSRLETRLSDQFHQQLVSQLSESNSKIAARPTPALNRLGLKRPTRSSWTSSNFLSLLWDSREHDQLGSAGSCPLVVQPDGITAQLHQSTITNYLDSVLAGRVIQSKDLERFAKQFGTDIGGDLAEEAQGEPWSITFASFHPVEIEFEDNLVSFQIRTVRLDRGKNAMTQPATIRATYRIEIVDGFIQLYRTGDVNIQFAGKAQRGTMGATMRGFLKSKFDRAFKETLFKEPIRPTDRLPADAPPLQVRSIETDSGWLQAYLN